jgi:hypothetical protein
MTQIKTFQQFIDTMPRKTKAFTTFAANHSQSFDLAALVRLGGKQRIEEFRQKGNEITQRIAGLDVKDYVALSKEEKHTLAVSPSDLAEMFSIAQESHKNDQSIERLATVTLPNVLITYLFAIFEAYLHNVITDTCQNDPNLLTSISQAKSANVQLQLQNMNTDAQIRYLIQITKLKDIFKIILEKGIGIKEALIWQAANSSFSELNKARIIRNLYVHKGGIIDAEFIKEMGNPKLTSGGFTPSYISIFTQDSPKYIIDHSGDRLTDHSKISATNRKLSDTKICNWLYTNNRNTSL